MTATSSSSKPPSSLGLPRRTSERRIGYFNGASVETLTQPGDFKGFRQETDSVLRSQPEAKAFMDGLDIRLDAWSQNAVARLWGDADIFPMMCVEVVTVREAFRYAKYDGKWMVRAVSHKANNQSFQSVLYLTRPDPDDYPSMSVTFKPFWEDEGRTRPYLTLHEERWVSSWS